MKSGILIGTAILLLVLLFAWLIRDLYLPGTENATIPPPIACTADAKLCPDGSAVGRTGQDCEFAPCPGASFLECEVAGNPIMESYPRQCRWENGTTVTESVPPVPEETAQPADPLACQTDADCVVKDVGSCCGYYPRCVNAGYEPDPEAVKDACAESGVSGICGYSVIDYCVCSNNACEGRQN